MWLQRSKRIAAFDAGGVARLRLTTPWQMALVASMVAALLVMVFPRESLLARLHGQDVRDALTLAYTQSLYRADPNNAELALLLARAQIDRADPPVLRALIGRWLTQGQAEQQAQALGILLASYGRWLYADPGTPEQRQVARADLLDLLAQTRTARLPAELHQSLSDFAFALDLPDLGLQHIDLAQPDRPLPSLLLHAQVALAHGDYQAAAQALLRAQAISPEPAQQRDLGQRAVQVLMSGNLYALASQTLRAQVQRWPNDRALLRFGLTQARAAGDAALAADLAESLVFVR